MDTAVVMEPVVMAYKHIVSCSCGKRFVVWDIRPVTRVTVVTCIDCSREGRNS